MEWLICYIKIRFLPEDDSYKCITKSAIKSSELQKKRLLKKRVKYFRGIEK